jgi:hypothetical protein
MTSSQYNPALMRTRYASKQMKLAMAVGTNRHYVVNTITGRHFVQTGEICGLPKNMVHDVIEEVGDTSAAKIDQVISSLPAGLPGADGGIDILAAKGRISSLSRALTSRRRERQTRISFGKETIFYGDQIVCFRHERKTTEGRNDLQICLGPYGLDRFFDENKLHIRADRITELSSTRPLSCAVLEAMFPKQSGPCEFFHYTKMTSLQSIASSGRLRLYSVEKRLGQGELDTFAYKHGLDGYLQSTNGHPLFYKELSKDMFYIPLTEPRREKRR